MEVFNLKPAEKISCFVESILVINVSETESPFQLPLFANGTPTLLFSTVPGQISDKSNYLTLFGQTVLPTKMVIPHSFKMVAYFLNPCALGLLFNITASELTDQPIALDLLERTSELQERLLNSPTVKKLIYIIDDYLYNKMKAILFEYSPLAHAVEKIKRDPGNDILRATHQELHMTERTFQRTFERQVGISPNLFRRISKFNRAFKQINERDFQDFSAIAYHNGYADQSHFIRTFREFTGLTPTQYLNIKRRV